METLGNEFAAIPPLKFVCNICHYNTNHKSHFDGHINSMRHCRRKQMEIDGNKFAAKSADSQPLINQSICQKQQYICDCGKEFKTNSGLWKHNKICISKNNIHNNQTKLNGIDKDDVIIMLLKQNAELIKCQQDIMTENKADLKEIVLEIVKNGTNNTTTNNTNSHNKAFNINFFLNETCKNAMNITDFVDSIKLQLSDLMEVGEIGYVEGISNIIVKKLNALDETIRPIHCTDQKRETFYVKDENKWEKEEEDFNRIRKMIKNVAYKNERLMSSYKEKYPDYNDPDSKRSDQYSKTVIEALGGDGENYKEKENKIIKNISRATHLSGKNK